MITTPNKMIFCAAVLAMSMLPHVKAAAGRGHVDPLSGVYYEPQLNNECGLHAVNCVLRATGQPATTSLVMEAAEPVERPVQQRGGNWSTQVIEDVLAARHLTCDVSIPPQNAQDFGFNFTPNATAWIVNDGGHWHAYVKNAQQDWYNVESFRNFQWMGQPVQRTAQEHAQNGPILVGNDAAMMQRIRLENAQDRATYRVAAAGGQQPAIARWMCSCGTDNLQSSAFCLGCYIVDRPAQQNSTSATSPQASSPELEEEEQKANDDPAAVSQPAMPQVSTYNPTPWDCLHCTYFNITGADNCGACNRRNPVLAC